MVSMVLIWFYRKLRGEKLRKAHGTVWANAHVGTYEKKTKEHTWVSEYDVMTYTTRHGSYNG